jgi:hypothetical protein
VSERQAQARPTGPPRHELPAIDELGLAAARATETALRAADARGEHRWADFLEPLPDQLRDADLAGLRSAARRARAAYGPRDSIRDSLPAEVTEPLLEAIDRLTRELDRYERSGRRG